MAVTGLELYNVPLELLDALPHPERLRHLYIEPTSPLAPSKNGRDPNAEDLQKQSAALDAA